MYTLYKLFCGSSVMIWYNASYLVLISIVFPMPFTMELPECVNNV